MSISIEVPFLTLLVFCCCTEWSGTELAELLLEANNESKKKNKAASRSFCERKKEKKKEKDNKEKDFWSL